MVCAGPPGCSRSTRRSPRWTVRADATVTSGRRLVTGPQSGTGSHSGGHPSMTGSTRSPSRMSGWPKSTVVVGIIGRIATWVKVGRILHIQWRDIRLLKDVGKIAIAAAMSGLVIALVRTSLSGMRPLNVLIVCAVVYGVVFLAGVVLLGVPAIEERLYLRKQFARLWPGLKPVSEPVARS